MNEEIKAAMREFCVRVLSGNGSPQEIATLPQILTMLEGKEGAVSGN